MSHLKRALFLPVRETRGGGRDHSRGESWLGSLPLEFEQAAKAPRNEAPELRGRRPQPSVRELSILAGSCLPPLRQERAILSTAQLRQGKTARFPRGQKAPREQAHVLLNGGLGAGAGGFGPTR